MTFTPTAASAGIAGFTFWGLVWTTLSKLDTIAALFGFKNRFFARQMRLWINDNKGLTICASEIVNFGIHGVKSAEGTLFAIGGTLFNCIYVFAINPLICRHDRRRIKVVARAKAAA